ncbi:MAG: Gldg family protein [bacterium]|nr:Gldg family protein [bacterium]
MARSKSKLVKQAYYWILLGIILVAVVLVNLISAYVNKKFDLTDDQRHSLSESTIDFLEKADSSFHGPVYIEVYLEGKLPAELKRFRNMVEDRLEEFTDIAGDRIEYKFTNPEDGKKEDAEELKRMLFNEGRGILPMFVEYKGEGQESQLILWPGAVIRYSGSAGTKELVVQLLPGTRTGRPFQLEELIQVVQGGMRNLEYNLMNGLRRITREKTPRVGFLQGHGELNFGATYRARSVIGADYSVENVTIDGKIDALDQYDGLVIARPTQRMSDEDLYLIDQFVMRGGRLMCFIDALEIREDSLRKNKQTHTVRIETGLDNLLYDYGISIKDNYVLDEKCGQKPLSLERKSRIPWFYHVLATPTDHPVSKNLEPVSLKYTSQLDYGKKPQNNQFVVSPILTSSTNSRVTGSSPLVAYAIPLNYLNPDNPRERPKLALDPDDPSNKKMLAAVSEGKFTSYYKRRLPPDFKNQKELKYKESSTKNGKVFVVGNSRMITNSYDSLMNPSGTDIMYRPKQGPNELEYDREMVQMGIQHLFGNEDFFMNLVDFMMGDNSVLALRSRQIEIHAIDKAKVQENAGFYQTINIGLPILLILTLAIVMYLIRKKKYA